MPSKQKPKGKRTPKKRGRPKLKPGETGPYPSSRKPAKRPGASPPIKMVKSIEKSLKMEESVFKRLYAIHKHRWQEIVRALILAHLEQATQPAPEAEAAAGSSSA